MPTSADESWSRSMTKKFLFVLHEMGTLDHAAALRSQILGGGGEVSHVIIGDNLLPPWAESEFLVTDRLTESEALRRLEAFDGVWLQEPYEELRPVKWRGLWERVPIVYSGYGVPLTNWKIGYFGLPFYDNCRLILGSGPLDKLEHHSASGGRRNVVITGDPLMFEVVNSHEQSRLSPVCRRVLWAPHWTRKWVDDARGFATWEWVVRVLHRFFRNHPEVELTVRPHPHLNFRLGSLFSQREARKLIELPNVSLSKSSMRSDIASADVLISDGVGILAYFGSTGKPVVVIQNDGHDSPFSELGREIVEAMKNVRSQNELAAVLVSLANGTLLLDMKSVRETILRHFIVADESPGKFLVENF